MDNEIVFESEKLTGYFRYIPKRTVARLSFSDNPELIASTLLCTLDEFEISNAAKEPVLGPNFPGEDKYLIESGVAPDRLGTVRYHGHNNPYDIDHKNVKEMVVVVSHKGRLHFWLCKQTEQGQFHESDWPHCDLSCELPDEELGQGIVAAIDILLASPSK